MVSVQGGGKLAGYYLGSMDILSVDCLLHIHGIDGSRPSGHGTTRQMMYVLHATLLGQYQKLMLSVERLIHPVRDASFFS